MAVSSTSQDKRKRRDVHKCSDDCVIFTMEQFAVLTNVQVKSMEYPTWKCITVNDYYLFIANSLQNKISFVKMRVV